MQILLALLGIIAIACFFVLRTRRAVGSVRELEHDTKRLPHDERSANAAEIGAPLGQVNDPALAAAVLMVQIVRSGGAMTAEEKTEILARLREPIGAADPQILFEQAWRRTTQEAFFSQVSDELTPLLKQSLSDGEKSDLVEMLRGVAEADGAASDLQRSSIARFQKRLNG